MTLRIQERVEQAEAVLVHRLGRWRLSALPCVDVQIGKMDGGAGIVGKAIAEVADLADRRSRLSADKRKSLRKALLQIITCTAAPQR